MSDFLLPLLLLLAGLCFWGAHALSPTNKHKVNRMIDELKKNRFNISQHLVFENLVMGSVVAIDNEKKQVAFAHCHGDQVWTEFYNAEDILECEVFEDGNSITKTSRGNQLTRAVIGGAILGGVGAIIGGATAATKTKATVSKLVLRVTVNKLDSPIKEITLLNKEVEKTSPVYRSASQQANLWNGIFKVLIHSANHQ